MSTKTRIAAGVLALCVPCVLYFEGTIRKAYRDPVGILTACTGHTGADIRPGQTFTQAQCDDMLMADLHKHDAAIDPCIRVPVTDGQRAAFLSFAFNVGSGAFCESTLARKLNSGDYAGACAELSRWTRAGGRELNGLVRRRAAERAMCEGRT